MTQRRALAPDFYGTDLAFVHHEGFTDFVRQAAPQVVALLRRCGIQAGDVLDLGCGAGQLAQALCNPGYRVTGIDVSPAFVKLARRRVPHATFVCGSIDDVALPACDAAAAVGEVLNYLPNEAALRRVATRLFTSLRPGGVLLLDLLLTSPGMPAVRTHVRQTDDWSITAVIRNEPGKSRVTRDITVFRRAAGHGQLFRRSHEVHRQRTYLPADAAELLRRCGFRVQIRRGYGRTPFPGGTHRVFVATKPRH